MKNTVKSWITRLVILLTLTTGFTVIGSAANAAPAHAGTASQCRMIDAGYGYTFYTNSGSGRYAAYCYVDYDWAEEVFLGQRDGYKIMTVSPYWCGGGIRQWVAACR